MSSCESTEQRVGETFFLRNFGETFPSRRSVKLDSNIVGRSVPVLHHQRLGRGDVQFRIRRTWTRSKTSRRWRCRHRRAHRPNCRCWPRPTSPPSRRTTSALKTKRRRSLAKPKAHRHQKSSGSTTASQSKRWYLTHVAGYCTIKSSSRVWARKTRATTAATPPIASATSTRTSFWTCWPSNPRSKIHRKMWPPPTVLTLSWLVKSSEPPNPSSNGSATVSSSSAADTESSTAAIYLLGVFFSVPLPLSERKLIHSVSAFFREVTFTDAGVYSCYASNKHGKVEGNGTLVVKGKFIHKSILASQQTHGIGET